MPQRRFLVPARLRQRFYRRNGAYWYRALIRNARDNAQELARIDAQLASSPGVSGLSRRLLRGRIARYLKTAKPEPPARDAYTASLCDSGFVEDTTAYEQPGSILIILPFRRRPPWSD